MPRDFAVILFDIVCLSSYSFLAWQCPETRKCRYSRCGSFSAFSVFGKQKRRPLSLAGKDQRIRLHYCTYGELARCQMVPDMIILLAYDLENRFSAPVSYLLPEPCSEMADFRPDGFRRFGTDSRIQYRACKGIRTPFSFSPAPDSLLSLYSGRLCVLADLFS